MAKQVIRGPLSQRFHDLRRAAGLSLDELAEKAGISKAYLCEISRGTKRNPTLRVVMQIAHALNMTLAELLAPVYPDDFNNSGKAPE